MTKIRSRAPSPGLPTQHFALANTCKKSHTILLLDYFPFWMLSEPAVSYSYGKINNWKDLSPLPARAAVTAYRVRGSDYPPEPLWPHIRSRALSPHQIIHHQAFAKVRLGRIRESAKSEVILDAGIPWGVKPLAVLGSGTNLRLELGSLGGVETHAGALQRSGWTSTIWMWHFLE